MTAEGTNTFVLGEAEVAVIDPGPADPAHLARIVAAVAGRPVRSILVTHSHLDHSPGARPLADRLDAPTLAFGPSEAGRSPVMAALSGLGGGEGVETGFVPDQTLADGELVAGADWTLVAHHTPGHMANHMTFEWREARAAFTGDTVMGWASTMISPPDGDVGQFMASLDRLERLGVTAFHPGHGDPVADPAGRCRALRAHRQAREAQVLAALDGPARIPALVAAIYADTPSALHPAAARNVLAHLIHLQERGRVAADGGVGPDATWHRV